MSVPHNYCMRTAFFYFISVETSGGCSGASSLEGSKF